jgi:hypothetical protein
MTSFEIDILVRERIRDRLQEAERARLGRLAMQTPGDTSRRPPRGPLFARVARRLAHVA